MNAYDRDLDAPSAPADLSTADEHPLLDRFRSGFRDEPYYSTGRTWNDYAPAYRFGIDAQVRAGQQAFEDAEAGLQAGWPRHDDPSRLAWAEARGAVEAAWRQSQAALHAMPGLVPGGAVRAADAGVQQAEGELDGGTRLEDSTDGDGERRR